MAFQTLVFYVFSAVMIAAAIFMITAKNPVRAALSLVLIFFTASATWLLMEAEFLAITLVLVYVGAVMVLFLFVVMMLDINVSEMREGFIHFLPVGVVAAVIMIAELVLVVASKQFEFNNAVPKPEDYSNTEALGLILYTQYLYPFEIAAVILLVAIIAAIVLTMRKRPKTRHQDASAQIKVKREDRIRIMKVESESK